MQALKLPAGRTANKLSARLQQSLSSMFVSRLAAPSGDDTAAIQAALDAAATRGDEVRGRRGATYIISRAGSRDVVLPSGSTGSHNYALAVPSGVYFNLNGATLQASDSGGTDFSMVVNQNMDLTTDADLGIGNGVLDHQNVTQSGHATLTLVGVTRPRVNDLRIVNSERAGMQTWNIADSEYDGVVAVDTVGNGFVLGQPQSGKGERGGRWGSLTATGATAWAANPTNFPGNSIYLVATDTAIGTIVADACTGGVKVGNPSADVTIDKVTVVNSGDGSGNSGFKVQGASGDLSYRISVGQIASSGCAGSGLYIEQYAADVQIGQYFGQGNAASASVPDVWVGGTRTQIGTLKSTSAGAQGVLVRDAATNCQFGDVTVRNCGQVAGSGSGDSTGYQQSAGSATVGSLISIDDQGTATMSRGVSISGGGSHIRKLRAYGMANPVVIYAGTGSLIQDPTCHASDATWGEVTPTASATSTAVSNGNFTAFGANFTAVVEVQAVNAAARSLTGVRWTASGTTLTIHHSAAAGTEVIRWRLLSYVVGTPQA